MVSYVFYLYGNICTNFPWEVIVSTISLTICILTMELHGIDMSLKKSSHLCCQQGHATSDIMIMTIIKCLAVLYNYYQFRNLQLLGSKYILGVTGLFMIFSSFLFIMVVLNFLQIDFSELQDAIFFFLLLIDLSKAARLANFALNSCDEIEIKNNIAKGLSVLGPTITLDTAVETLVIGIGTLSGVPRLEILCYFACLSVIVNYIVFMTFYPSSLFLLLELSKGTSRKHQNISAVPFSESNEKTNPIVERVKIIMTICLLLIHLIIRQSFQRNVDLHVTIDKTLISSYILITTYLSYLFNFCIDNVIVLILLLALIIKCLYFETIDNKLGIRQKLSSANEVGIQVNCLDLTEITCSSTKCIKTIDECVSIYKKELDVDRLTNNEIIQLVLNKHISMYQLENVVRDSKRAVMIRRQVFGKEERYKNIFCSLPIDNFDYDKVFGTCCENVVGYIPIPLGIAGPIKINNHLYNIPMATTEGCLVASITRGCKAVSLYGVESKVIHDGMTRGPVVRFPSASRASVALKWLQNLSNFNLLKQKFDSTSRYAQLIKLKPCIAGRYLFIRFVATTGDAMGMNMLSKATETSLKYMQERFLDMKLLSLSGNFCTDKKPAYINWIEGRGKSVISEAIVPSTTITSVLKTTVSAIVDVNISKNLIGSSLAGAVGGNNAHAANVVTAIFLATGQDPAQNVVSSNCITLVEPWGPKGEDLYISCTMPSLEVGTVGGGTILSAQGACLDMLGIKGGHPKQPGENSNQLARIICSTVLAGELSLLAALSAGHVVKSHLKLNRSTSAMK